MENERRVGSMWVRLADVHVGTGGRLHGSDECARGAWASMVSEVAGVRTPGLADVHMGAVSVHVGLGERVREGWMACTWGWWACTWALVDVHMGLAGLHMRAGWRAYGVGGHTCGRWQTCT